ncbi:MAG: hypothetical protein P0Y50_08765 [Candidatus Brevundimonas colombiensis]|uniref:Lipoprotein n=1 Tax=Candidatus Brevundimonas colombiensis TaxID=3121376 RepID=A0AAJ6BIS6_9CAUL|nr:hypothetical protein [Brevundimonas sp.]WEK38643.1 MAG: hypothetical protein P0Y50_08765 [Brevundimonas sp.]
MARIRFLIAPMLLLSACSQATAPAKTGDIAETVTLKSCPTPDPGRACEYDHATLPGEMTKAMAGDYQAQRNVSEAFTNDAPWIVKDAVAGCAWRIVAIANRPATSTYDDDGMYRVQCERLSPTDLAQARGQAAQITEAVRP